jgi:hypothetical protein
VEKLSPDQRNPIIQLACRTGGVLDAFLKKEK